MIERLDRIKEKLNYASDRLEDVKQWIEDYKKSNNKKDLAASMKAFQEVVEALTDAVALIIRHINYSIKDDYSNFELLETKGIITKEQKEICIEANGLRNRIIHRYNHVDDIIFVESCEKLITGIKKVLKHLQNKIQEFK